MERIFTQDHGRYKKGDKKDWPVTTWRSFFPDYEQFTISADEAAVLAANSVKKGGKDVSTRTNR